MRFLQKLKLLRTQRQKQSSSSSSSSSSYNKLKQQTPSYATTTTTTSGQTKIYCWWVPADGKKAGHHRNYHHHHRHQELRNLTKHIQEEQSRHHNRHHDPRRAVDIHHKTSKFNPATLSKKAIVLVIGLLGMVYQAEQKLQPQTEEPPQEKNSATNHDDKSSKNETSNGQHHLKSEESIEEEQWQKIKLKDGRNLAYREGGVPKSKSNYKIILVHGFGSSKEMSFLAPKDLIQELGIYFLQFDRAGYGDSDPNPKRSVKSEALDIQELADQLEIGSKFFVIGVSMGSYPIWSCLKYIPDRLAGAALIVPCVNYKWPSLPKSLVKDDWRRRLVNLTYWFSKHAPGLLHWWVTHKWTPSSSVLEKNRVFFNPHDIEILKKIPGFPMLTQEGLRHRQNFDTLRHDFLTGFGSWEFDPTELKNPLSESKSNIHIWTGYEDRVVPFQLQRHVAGKLPWIQYHEIPEGGHLIVHYNGLCEVVLKSLLLGEEPSSLDKILP